MSSNVTDRAAVRSQLATLLASALVGAGKPAQAVYAYQVGDFDKLSPVIVVTGAGTGRGNPLITDPTDFFLDVHTFVLYATEDGGWTEQQSEDRLDLLEKSISDVIKDANDSGLWESIVPNGESQIDGLEIGGLEYRHEVIPVRVVVQDF